VAREEESNGESCSGGRPGSDAWDRREAGGGAGLLRRQAAARGVARADGGRRGKAGKGQRGVGESGSEAGEGTWMSAGRRWDSGGGAHGRQSSGGGAHRETEEEEREVDEGGPKCDLQKI
jgi:hypothetical protein